MSVSKNSLLELVGDFPHMADLIKAFDQNCTCEYEMTADYPPEPTGAIIGKPCGSCEMLAQPLAIRQLQYVKTYAFDYVVNEHRPQKHAAGWDVEQAA